MDRNMLEFIDIQIGLYESLIELSEEMRLAIVGRDLDRLLQITNSQSEVIKKLFSPDSVNTGGFYEEDLESFISKLTVEEQNIVREKIKYLGELVVKLDDLVEINSRLLNQSLGLLEKYIDILKKNTTFQGPIFLEDRG